MTETFEQFADYLKANDVTGDHDGDDDKKLTSKLKEFVAAMVIADPSRSEEEHLYRLLHTSRGVRRAELMNELSKNQKEQPMSRTDEMAEMQKFVKQGGMTAVAKRIIETGGTSLTEHEYSDLWKSAAGSTAAFAKEFEGPPNERHRAYAVVRDANHAKTYLKLNMMDTVPRVTEVGDTRESDDSMKAVQALKDLAALQHKTFEQVMLDNPELTARTYTSAHRPTTSSTSGSELQRR
jgi:hypothetical protein